MNRKRKLAAAAAGLAVWAVLLFALTAAERGQTGGIRTVWDAAWYSVVTLTTAGYGDIVPVTVAGKLIGILLMVLSVGLWAALIGAVWTTLRDSILPSWRLARVRRKPWYVFSERNEESEALALDLLKQNPDGRAVFCSDSGARLRVPAVRSLSFPGNIQTLMSPRFAGKGPRTVFLTGRDGWANASAAKELVSRCGAVYSRGEEAAGVPGVRCFDPAVLCARQYWLGNPAGPEETLFLLCGDGARARAMLCEGLLACCREPFQRTEFHAFGDWADFRRMHPELKTVVYHEEPWNADRDLLERADRIIFASEDERTNAEQAAALNRAFPLRGAVHAATALPAPCGLRFGSPEQTCTGELVTQQSLDRLAVALHRAYGRRTGDGTAWESLSAFLKDSNRAAADHLLTKLRILLPDEDIRRADRAACGRAAARYAALSAEERENCLRNEHARWCLFHTLHNWRFAPVRDNSRRLHPCLAPYESLSEEDRNKDATAWEMIGGIAEEAEL